MQAAGRCFEAAVFKELTVAALVERERILKER
jgi:hypothetical protein